MSGILVGASVIKSAASGPTLVETDNFNYANSSVLAGQGVWSSVNGTITVFNPGGFTGTGQSCCRSTTTYNANHRCEVTIGTLGGAFDFTSAQVRCQSGADTRYWFQSDGTNWYLVVRNAGSQTVISSGTHTTLSNGDKISCEASGAGSSTRLTTQIYHSGAWTTVNSAVDPGGTYIDNGSAGVGADGGLSRGSFFAGYNL